VSVKPGQAHLHRSVRMIGVACGCYVGHHASGVAPRPSPYQLLTAAGARLKMRQTTMAGRVVSALAVGVLLAACGGNSGRTTRVTPTPTPASNSTAADTPAPTLLPSPTPARVTPHPTPRPTGAPTPKHAPPSGAQHVLVIMEENKGYAATLGKCSADPYFCSLASKYASFTNSHGVSHPSEPNYVAFDSGGINGCTTDGSCAANSLSQTDLGGQLTAADVPWVDWQESMPSACFTGGSSGGYALKHNAFQMFKDNQATCHSLPYPGSSAAVSALDGASAPDFAWISPNLTDDMHDGTVQQGDAWLKANLSPILASSWFLDYKSTVIVTMDEGDAGGANQIPTVVISSHAAGVGGVGTSINHYAVLRAIEGVYGLGYLGNAASAPGISNFFG